MAKKPTVEASVADMQPDELNALKALVQEFINRAASIDNELETLKEDRKALIDEFSDKLDMKTLQAALRVVKIQNAVQHRDTYDLFVEALTDPAQ